MFLYNIVAKTRKNPTIFSKKKASENASVPHYVVANHNYVMKNVDLSAIDEVSDAWANTTPWNFNKFCVWSQPTVISHHEGLWPGTCDLRALWKHIWAYWLFVYTYSSVWGPGSLTYWDRWARANSRACWRNTGNGQLIQIIVQVNACTVCLDTITLSNTAWLSACYT